MRSSINLINKERAANRLCTKHLTANWILWRRIYLMRSEILNWKWERRSTSWLRAWMIWKRMDQSQPINWRAQCNHWSKQSGNWKPCLSLSRPKIKLSLIEWVKISTISLLMLLSWPMSSNPNDGLYFVILCWTDHSVLEFSECGHKDALIIGREISFKMFTLVSIVFLYVILPLKSQRMIPPMHY